jgi:phytoene synthase
LTRRGAGDPRALPPREAQSAARTLIADLAQEARDALREARAAAGGNDRIVPALLPLALIEPYLQALESPGHDPLSELADISPLARVWRLWRARQRGRF